MGKWWLSGCIFALKYILMKCVSLQKRLKANAFIFYHMTYVRTILGLLVNFLSISDAFHYASCFVTFCIYLM